MIDKQDTKKMLSQFKDVGKKHLNSIVVVDLEKEVEDIVNNKKEFELKIFQRTFCRRYLEKFWKDIDFLLFLEGTDFQEYAMIIARVNFENMVKMIYFFNVSKEKTKEEKEKEQEKIIKRSILNTSRLKYFEFKSANIKDHIILWKQIYDFFKEDGEENIDEKESQIESFSNVRTMLQVLQSKQCYSLYKDLSGYIHGNLLEGYNNNYVLALNIVYKNADEIIKFCVSNRCTDDLHV